MWSTRGLGFSSCTQEIRLQERSFFLCHPPSSNIMTDVARTITRFKFKKLCYYSCRWDLRSILCNPKSRTSLKLAMVEFLEEREWLLIQALGLRCLRKRIIKWSDGSFSCDGQGCVKLLWMFQMAFNNFWKLSESFASTQDFQQLLKYDVAYTVMYGKVMWPRNVLWMGLVDKRKQRWI